jgi:hypothetical protein
MPYDLDPRMEVLPNEAVCSACLGKSRVAYDMGGEMVYAVKTCRREFSSPFGLSEGRSSLRDMKYRWKNGEKARRRSLDVVTLLKKGTMNPKNCIILGYADPRELGDGRLSFTNHKEDDVLIRQGESTAVYKGAEMTWENYVRLSKNTPKTLRESRIAEMPNGFVVFEGMGDATHVTDFFGGIGNFPLTPLTDEYLMDLVRRFGRMR